MITLLESAGTTLEEAEVGGAAFSHYGLDVAVAYPGAHAWAVRHAQSKKAHVESIQERLNSTADAWDQAEQQNTMQPLNVELIWMGLLTADDDAVGLAVLAAVAMLE